MKARYLSFFPVICFGLVFVFLVANANAQQPQSTPSDKDDVIRVNTNLIQTDVMVFDKNGKFVQGLKRDEFELKIDGKRRDISFFEQIKAGKINEEAKIAAARGQQPSVNNQSAQQSQTIPLDRGRIVYIFIDDLHLSAESTIRTKKMLRRFIEREVGQNDLAAITTASGQLGFLQQLTDNKEVLYKAINNLKYYGADIKDNEFPPMTLPQAKLIDQNMTDVLDYFIDEFLKRNPGTPRSVAGQLIMGRARGLLQQSSNFSDGTLRSLKNLIRESAQLNTRKLIFFISDGFLIENNFGSTTNLITQVSSEASKSNAVIYSLDARGLISGLPDASDNAQPDPYGRLARAAGNDVVATQDPLNALAINTGGRAIFNTNDAEPLVKKALEETSEYYLLAWAADDDSIRGEKFRKVEVRVTGRPDLVVKSRRGYISNEKPQKTTPSAENQKPIKDLVTRELVSAIKSIAPLESLPTSVSSFYHHSPQHGMVVTTLIEIQIDALTFEIIEEKPKTTNDATEKDASASKPIENKPKAVVDAVGYVINEQGKTVANFYDRWIITSLVALNEQTQTGAVNSFLAKVTPGLYQIRVATRETKSGKIGNSSTWIEVPDLSLKKLALGSLLIAERVSSDLQKTSDEKPDPLQQGSIISISRRFSSSSYLRFIATIFNATLPETTGALPDIVVQVQVFRDDQPVITTELMKVKTEGVTNFSQIPYAAEVSLKGMPAGYYVLKMTVIDRVAKTSATQKTNFIIE